MTYQVWIADPHQFGAGKIHVIDDTNTTKTMCGRFTSAIPGKPSATAGATCKTCLNAVVSRPVREQEMEAYRQKAAQREEDRKAANETWWRWYSAYLESAPWKHRRALVLKRSGGVCEGCGIEHATEVHHTTYQHVGNEMLWELRAICKSCHDMVTELDREARR